MDRSAQARHSPRPPHSGHKYRRRLPVPTLWLTLSCLQAAWLDDIPQPTFGLTAGSQTPRPLHPRVRPRLSGRHRPTALLLKTSAYGNLCRPTLFRVLHSPNQDQPHLHLPTAAAQWTASETGRGMPPTVGTIRTYPSGTTPRRQREGAAWLIFLTLPTLPRGKTKTKSILGVKMTANENAYNDGARTNTSNIWPIPLSIGAGA